MFFNFHFQSKFDDFVLYLFLTGNQKAKNIIVTELTVRGLFIIYFTQYPKVSWVVA